MPDLNDRNKPEYRTVESERDISLLIPGDRVPVVLEAGKPSVIMVYEGHSHHPIRPRTRCAFIEIPTQPIFNTFEIWESDLTYLQFPGGSVQFNSLHRSIRFAYQESEEFRSVQQLVDSLSP